MGYMKQNMEMQEVIVFKYVEQSGGVNGPNMLVSPFECIRIWIPKASLLSTCL